jgi:hypothetical protein
MAAVRAFQHRDVVTNGSSADTFANEVEPNAEFAEFSVVKTHA